MLPSRAEGVFQGTVLRVDVEQWSDPDRVREVVHHPGAAAVLTLTGDERVVLIRQFREAVRTVLMEIPAGIYDVEDESPEDTARREVLEETGYRITSLHRLGRIHTSPGFVDETIDLFLAEAERTADPEAGIEIVEIPLEEAVRLVVDGRIVDAKTAVAVMLGWTRLRGGEPSPTSTS